MIIVIAGEYPIYDSHGIKTGKNEYVASHGVDYETGRNVVLEQVHPRDLGAVFDRPLSEWVIRD